MIAVFLLLIVGGIGLTLAVSDPRQVTLRWMRLGGIIAGCLLAVTAVIVVGGEDHWMASDWLCFSGTTAMFVTQLTAVQLARRRLQRAAALLGWSLASWTIVSYLTDISAIEHSNWMALTVTIAVSSAVTGGFLMTMLLGHAYLTARNEMTQRPFLRLTTMLGVLLVIRLLLSALLAGWPYFENDQLVYRPWDVMMMTTRYLVGLVVPGLFVYMIYDCVKRRVNQSATGILYVALVLVIIGEGTALALLRATGRAF